MTTKTITSAVVARDLKKAAPRTQEVCRLLQRKSGITAHELRDATGAVTKHNAWSLQRMADQFGFLFEISAEPDSNGYKRYYFTKPAKVANENAKASKKAVAAKVSTETKTEATKASKARAKRA
jgi:hypothetical protein